MYGEVRILQLYQVAVPRSLLRYLPVLSAGVVVYGFVDIDVVRNFEKPFCFWGGWWFRRFGRCWWEEGLGPSPFIDLVSQLVLPAADASSETHGDEGFTEETMVYE